ncbi:DUF6279 family lipoprotein [Shewanella seohaensis]|uniref:DUF6279 family lipoprotein n=1 Tax=Shewanella seohaensis TaxID=755175 RepID=UPI00200FB2FE|nr:DUF6279 family lipoprotein [Shewanella seohaensis]MCL1119589.1 DUF6279 family lipoprotein [Shewanella seohaensis]UXM80461.1 DUF6279 family lipoprotein [Shewanella seohaensis]
MKKGVLLLVLLFGLTACSTKFSYHFLDWAIGWELDDYVSLDKNQQKVVDGLIDKFVLWHQSEELGHYVAQLTEVEQQIQTNTLTPALWAEHVTLAKRHWFRLFEFALPEMLPIISSLTDEQVKQILAQSRKDEQELIKEFAGKTPEQLQQEADENLIEQFDDWLGSITDEQKTLIHQYNQQRLSTLDMWLDYRHEWLRQFEVALGQRSDIPLLTERLTLLMTRPDELKSEKHRAILRQNTEAFGGLLLTINASLSAKQSKHFYKKLNKLIQDLRELNQKGIEKVAKATKD